MNNYIYPLPPSLTQQTLEELRKIDKRLEQIEVKLNEIVKKEENKYLDKDDNFYII